MDQERRSDVWRVTRRTCTWGGLMVWSSGGCLIQQRQTPRYVLANIIISVANLFTAEWLDYETPIYPFPQAGCIKDYPPAQGL